jgi:hypothetical protein
MRRRAALAMPGGAVTHFIAGKCTRTMRQVRLNQAVNQAGNTPVDR